MNLEAILWDDGEPIDDGEDEPLPPDEQQPLSYLEKLAKRHSFDPVAAYKWVEATKYNIPYAMLKVSGSCLTDELAEDIADLSHIIPLAVIVGGGDEITAECRRRGLPVQKSGPWRVTTREVLDVVVEVMTGLANKFADMIKQYGGNSLPLVGTPYQPLIFADRVKEFVINGERIEAGYFGMVPESKVDTYLSKALLESILNAPDGAVPVIAALGHEWAAEIPSGGHQYLNVDGDEVMRLIAHRVESEGWEGPEEFLFVTPSGGVKERRGGRERVVQRLFFVDYKMLRSGLVIDESMELKLGAAFNILREYGGSRGVGVALVPPHEVVPALLDRSPTYDSLLAIPPSRFAYGTTLAL